MDTPKITHPGIRAMVGLGNPGPTYAETRHNAGAWFVQTFCEAQKLNLKSETRFPGFCSAYAFESHTLRLMIPNVFMNLSGGAVQRFLKYYQIPPEQLLIVHDELDLPVGTARLKLGGGHGGHNGLRDIVQQLGTTDFCRLRLGIGRPSHSQHPVADFVLAPPSASDKTTLMQTISETLSCMPGLISGHWDRSVQQLHSPGDSRGV